MKRTSFLGVSSRRSCRSSEKHSTSASSALLVGAQTWITDIEHRVLQKTVQSPISCCICTFPYFMLQIRFIYLGGRGKQAMCGITVWDDLKRTLLTSCITMLHISGKFSLYLALGLMQGRMLSLIFFSGTQFSWHRPSSRSCLHWKIKSKANSEKRYQRKPICSYEYVI